MTQQHCTRDTVRKTPNSAWPLRNSAGLTWAEARSAASPKATTPTSVVGDALGRGASQ